MPFISQQKNSSRTGWHLHVSPRTVTDCLYKQSAFFPLVLGWTLEAFLLLGSKEQNSTILYSHSRTFQETCKFYIANFTIGVLESFFYI